MPSTYKLLISAEELASQLDADGLVVIDCRFNLLEPAAGRQAWLEGHIPGAFYADLDQHLASPKTATSGRHPLPDPEAFALLLASWGITPTSRVVAYDAAGGALAARLWWLLRWVGHERVMLLDGGWDAWLEQRLPQSTASPQLQQGRYPVKPGGMPVMATEAVQAALEQKALMLLDARDGARFNGEVEPIDTRAGHVPGAVNRPFQTNLDARGHFRAAADLADSFATMGITDSAGVACMCGSGVTACHNLFATQLAGVSGPPPALYVGSWSEWISGDRPVATVSHVE